jgi:hypothetical protein
MGPRRSKNRAMGTERAVSEASLRSIATSNGSVAGCVPMKSQSEVIDFDVYDRIEPGEYLAYCREALLNFNPRFGRRSAFLGWDVYDANGTKIATAKRWLPIGTRNGKPHVGRGTLFYQWWTQANGGHPPTRGDRMTATIFKDRMARVLIADSEPPPRHKGKAPLHHSPYSKVSEVLNWETGLR